MSRLSSVWIRHELKLLNVAKHVIILKRLGVWGPVILPPVPLLARAAFNTELAFLTKLILNLKKIITCTQIKLILL